MTKPDFSNFNPETHDLIHIGCGGKMILFSSFTDHFDVETPICSKCGAQGEQIRKRID